MFFWQVKGWYWAILRFSWLRLRALSVTDMDQVRPILSTPVHIESVSVPPRRLSCILWYVLNLTTGLSVFVFRVISSSFFVVESPLVENGSLPLIAILWYVHIHVSEICPVVLAGKILIVWVWKRPHIPISNCMLLCLIIHIDLMEYFNLIPRTPESSIFHLLKPLVDSWIKKSERGISLNH